jgi:hypothetical protein
MYKRKGNTQNPDSYGWIARMHEVLRSIHKDPDQHTSKTSGQQASWDSVWAAKGEQQQMQSRI